MLRVVAGLGLIALFVSLDAPAGSQSATRSCVVVADGRGVHRWAAGSAADCGTRLSPASTYKIPHALIGLETGVVTATSVEKWDGTNDAHQAKWNQDHTVLSAMKPSVLWFFQKMAPRIGAARAKVWLDRFEYGNRDTSGPVDRYWVNGTLRISPDEQLAFLRKFYDGTLPLSKAHVDSVIGALEQAPGTSRTRGASIDSMPPGKTASRSTRRPARRQFPRARASAGWSAG